MPDSDHGKPFDETSKHRVDEWSRAVFDACRGWPLAGSGRWFRPDEGGIRLRIEDVEGEPLEPLLAIELDTSDGQILVDFGSWATPISPPGGSLPAAAEAALVEARELVEGWLRGEVKLASYSDATGWHGSKLVHGGALPAAIEPVPVEIGDGGRVTVKSPHRREWRSWRRTRDGLWIECETHEA